MICSFTRDLNSRVGCLCGLFAFPCEQLHSSRQRDFMLFFLLYVSVGFFSRGSICVNCWWGRLCVFSVCVCVCGVVLVHLGGAGAPLVTRATPEGTTCEHTADRAAVIGISINHEEWSGQRENRQGGLAGCCYRDCACCYRFNDWFLIGDWFKKQQQQFTSCRWHAESQVGIMNLFHCLNNSP